MFQVKRKREIECLMQYKKRERNMGKLNCFTDSRPLFIAGAPEDEGLSAIRQWHLRNITSFKGAWGRGGGGCFYA